MMQKLLSLPPNLVSAFYDLEEVDRSEWFCTSDPVGQKLGSGGGTTWLLSEWERNRGAVAQAAEKSNEIADRVQEATDHTRKVFEAVEKVRDMSSKISDDSQSVSAATEEQSASEEEMAAACQQLSRMAEELAEGIHKFRV